MTLVRREETWYDLHVLAVTVERKALYGTSEGFAGRFVLDQRLPGWIDSLSARLLPTFVCSTVEREVLHPLTVKGLPVAAALQFRNWCDKEIIVRQDPIQAVDWYHTGENAATALAIENDYVLLIDDQNPYHFARSRGLKVVNSADFVVLLYSAGQLAYATAESTIGGLGLGKHLGRTALAAL
jgi:hypothetical protein